MDYGVLAPDGSIDVEVEKCAVSGLPVLGEHATMEQIGKSHFVRVLSYKTHLITDELRAKWYADCGETVAVDEPAVELKATRRKGTPAAAVDITSEE